MKLTICTALWQRHALAPVWWSAVQRIRRSFARGGIQAEVCVGGDEQAHRERAEEQGAEWVEVPNRPLGRKWNAIVEAACLSGTDFILILGSDDFLADSIIDRYSELLRGGWLHLGLCGCYVWELATGRVGLYQPSDAPMGQPIGAGRVVAAALLSPLDYRPWLDALNDHMDNDMTVRCRLPPAYRLAVGPALVAVDVKGGDNVWSYDQLRATTFLQPIASLPVDLPEWGAIGQCFNETMSPHDLGGRPT